ncbi:MAG: energy transducer TonB family protein [Oceanihabitans sp.]
MVFTNKHKAFCITFLLTGTVLFTMFRFKIQQQQKQIAESFYEIIPENKELEIPEENSLQAETNKAFNQNQKSNRFAKAYQVIAPPEDYVPPNLANIESDESAFQQQKVSKTTTKTKQEEEAYNKVNTLLKTQNKNQANNARSTVQYSLLNRKHQFLPTPIYLCETGGKIIVNITVNATGKVIEASYNNASSTSNACLLNHAIEYAKKAKFQSALQEKQIGTITFYFKAKS